MENFLGETIVDVKDTMFKDYTPTDWAMYFIESYGQIDGSHHKTWVLDQVARILKGTNVIVSLAKWGNGHSEYRVTLDDPSSNYENWVLDMQGEYIIEDDSYEYAYETGIAP